MADLSQYSVFGSDMDGVEMQHHRCAQTWRVHGSSDYWPTLAILVHQAAWHRCSDVIDSDAVENQADLTAEQPSPTVNPRRDGLERPQLTVNPPETVTAREIREVIQNWPGQRTI